MCLWALPHSPKKGRELGFRNCLEHPRLRDREDRPGAVACREKQNPGFVTLDLDPPLLVESTRNESYRRFVFCTLGVVAPRVHIRLWTSGKPIQPRSTPEKGMTRKGCHKLSAYPWCPLLCLFIPPQIEKVSLGGRVACIYVGVLEGGARAYLIRDLKWPPQAPSLQTCDQWNCPRRFPDCASLPFTCCKLGSRAGRPAG